MVNLPETITIDFDAYPGESLGIIFNSAWRICNKLRDQLAPFVDVSNVYKNMKVEVVPQQTLELRQAGAVGLAYRDRNITVIPPGLSRTMVAPFSGVLSMEIAHTMIARLTGSMKVCNDLVHYLYNGNFLIRDEYVSAYNLHYFGGNLTLVIPDLSYGWQNKDRIMKEIAEGKAPGGANPYWTAPVNASKPAPSFVAAERHELEHIKNFLVYGDVHGARL